jgi:flagellin
MSLGVLNNLSAVYAENNLNNTNNSLNTVLQQLSSGSKINSGADDAAGLSLVDGLEANQTALTQSVTNATEGVGLLQVADGALSQVTSLLNRAVTLATEASNGTLNASQDTAANQEYQSILSEISNIGSTTTYNDTTVFGSTTNIYTGDSSTAGSSVDALNIRTLSSSNVGDTGGAMSYSNGSNNVFLNLSTSSENAKATDTLNASGATTINVNYLVKGANGMESTATTSITVGTGTSYANTANGLMGAINNSGLGLTASFTTQAGAGVTGGGTETGIEITGGLVSAGVDPSAVSTSGTLNPSGIAANELLAQGQVVTVKVGDTTAAAITINSTVSTLSQLASAINTAAANGGTGSPSTLVTASVITNSDGTQSLSLSDSASSGGALSVTTTAGSALTPTFASATGSVGSSTSALSSVDTTDATGTAAVTAVDGSLTVGVGAISSDNSLSGTYVVTNTPTTGSAVSETFVMGGSGGTDAGNTGALSGTTFTVNGNSLANLEAAITGQKTAGSGSLGLGVTVTDGTDGATAFTLAGATGNTVTTDATGMTYTDTLTGATPAMSTSTSTAGVASLSVAQANAGTDAMTGSIVLQNTGGTATTFVMGAGTNNTTDAAVGGVAANTYYTGNETSGELGTDTAGTLAALKDTINTVLGTSVTASVTTAGLTVTSNTAGDNVTSGANTLANANATLGLYTPTVAGTGEYATALLAVTNTAGTTVTGAIGSSDNLTGSIVLTNGGVSDTFVMGNDPTGTSLTGLNSSATLSTSGGNTYYVGPGGTSALTTAINALGTAEGSTGLNLTATAGASGGINLQSSVVEGGTPAPISFTGTLAAAQDASATSSVTGAVASAGTASTVTVAPASGTVNTTDTLTGKVVLTNTPTSGSAVTETFLLGGSGGTDGGGTGTLSGTTFTINGSTLADLQAAINSQQTAGTGSLGLGLTALASTDGLSVSASTNNGNTVGATSTLVDTTQGTYSSISMGSFASESDTVSGDFTIKVGTAPAETVNLTSGETVSQMINQINGTTTTDGVTTSTNPYGVTATWVAPSGSDNYGSIELTSNTAGTAGNITTASESITDTPASATLNYTANSASDMGLSGAITDSTTTAAATFSSDAKSSSGMATISYTDAAGQSLSTTDLSNQTDAESALTNLNAAITDVAAQDGYIGAQINTLNAVSQVLSTQQENVESAQNAVQATDYASATSNMSKYEILSQTGIAALAQANSIQQEVTKLLQ